MVEPGKSFCDGGCVVKHANSPLYFSQVTSGHDGRGLVVDSNLYVARKHLFVSLLVFLCSFACVCVIVCLFVCLFVYGNNPDFLNEKQDMKKLDD